MGVASKQNMTDGLKTDHFYKNSPMLEDSSKGVLFKGYIALVSKGLNVHIPNCSTHVRNHTCGPSDHSGSTRDHR